MSFSVNSSRKVYRSFFVRMQNLHQTTGHVPHYDEMQIVGHLHFHTQERKKSRSGGCWVLHVHMNWKIVMFSLLYLWHMFFMMRHVIWFYHHFAIGFMLQHLEHANIISKHLMWPNWDKIDHILKIAMFQAMMIFEYSLVEYLMFIDISLLHSTRSENLLIVNWKLNIHVPSCCKNGFGYVLWSLLSKDSRVKLFEPWKTTKAQVEWRLWIDVTVTLFCSFEWELACRSVSPCVSSKLDQHASIWRQQ